MTFSELVSLFTAQGFDYLQPSEAETYLNAAYQVDICEAADWPFLEATATGSGPLTISNLGSVDYVRDTTQGTKLTPMDPRNISDYSPTLASEGVPRHYYLTGEGELHVYPLSSDTLSVRYFATAPALSGSAVPVIPTRFHTLIVDGAVARAYENSDDYELAQNAETKFLSRLGHMREVLMNPYRDGPDDFITVTDPLAF